MGYSTRFTGHIGVDPPLSEQEVSFLAAFSETRHMRRAEGPYHVAPDEDVLGMAPGNVDNVNAPPRGQPCLYCNLEPSADGTRIRWNGNEKSYNVDVWVKYLIDHFLAPGAIAKPQLPFLQANHVLNGVMEAQGEDPSDRWDLIVERNRVFTRPYALVADARRYEVL